jgi:hypothetical protein
MSLGPSGLSTLLFGPMKQSWKFHTNEEVKMTICEWLWMQEPDSYNELFYLCQDGINASSAWALLKNNDTSVE